MSAPKPSPGSWFIEKYNEASWVVSTDGLPERDEEGHFANVVFDGIGNEADAHLGAAAKDLLEALKETVNHVAAPPAQRDQEWHEEGNRIYLRARAALAKAKGES